MKLIIAGSRTVNLTVEEVQQVLQDFGIHPDEIDEIVCGKAKGMDTSGEAWAIANNKTVTYFPADWDTNGKAAGPIRNKQMGQYADAAVIVTKQDWTPGSKNMHDVMKRLKKVVYVYKMPTV